MTRVAALVADMKQLTGIVASGSHQQDGGLTQIVQSMSSQHQAVQEIAAAAGQMAAQAESLHEISQDLARLAG
jgi:methyl-accepting chemotaxis protein